MSRAKLIAAVLVTAAAAAFPLFEGANVSLMGLATQALTYGLVTLSLNLLTGFGGQVSIGHGGQHAGGADTPPQQAPP